MKKIIILIIVIIILSVLTQYVSSQDNLQKDRYKPYTENEHIDYFSLGVITGKYEIERFNKRGHLVLENDDYSKTLRITGLGWTYDYGGDIPYMTFGSVITHKLVIVEFYGFRINGRVFGFGTKNINYG